jgi:serine protease Do
MERGDTLVAVNGTPIKNVEDLTQVTRSLVDGKKDPVPVLAVFERKAARYLAVVRIGLEDLKDPGLEVTKAWLPIETHTITPEIARQSGQPSLKGFYITRVYPGLSADKAGLMPGDFITALDGEKLGASGPEYDDELSVLIRQYDIGKTVELAVVRDGKPMKINVELIQSPRLQREMKKYHDSNFEFTARDVSFFDRAEEQWSDDQNGVLVEDIQAGSWAELGSLSGEDLIVEVDGKSVDNVEMLRQRMEDIATTHPSVVRMKVLRGIHTSYLEIEPNWKTQQ